MQCRCPACTCMYLYWPWALCFSAEDYRSIKTRCHAHTLSSSVFMNDKSIPGCLCQEIKLCRGNCGSLPLLVHRLVCVGCKCRVILSPYAAVCELCTRKLLFVSVYISCRSVFYCTKRHPLSYIVVRISVCVCVTLCVSFHCYKFPHLQG